MAALLVSRAARIVTYASTRSKPPQPHSETLLHVEPGRKLARFVPRPKTGAPRRHRFGIVERDREERARALYHAWVAKHLGVDSSHPTKDERPRTPKSNGPVPLSGSLLEVGSSLIDSERARIRSAEGLRRCGTLDPRVFSDRKKQIHDFLAFLNVRHGDGAVARLRLSDLTMNDIEAYNRHIADNGYSASQVTKRMQVVRAIIDRAGRRNSQPEIVLGGTKNAA